MIFCYSMFPGPGNIFRVKDFGTMLILGETLLHMTHMFSTWPNFISMALDINL